MFGKRLVSAAARLAFFTLLVVLTTSFGADARSILGHIAASAKPLRVEDAEGHYHAALALADELGMRPLAAHCHFDRGKLYRETGKRKEAHEHLTTATTMYREMGMRFWLEQAEAELKPPV